MNPTEPQWVEEDCFELGGHHFRVARDFKTMFGPEPDRELLLAKSPVMIDLYQELAAAGRCDHLVEIGIFRGGSTAFLHTLFQPAKLVAVDIKERPSASLDAFRADLRNPDSLSCHFEVDQADTRRLQDILDREFSGAALDLVIDDASHLLEETRVSFNLLFPRLRPGGIYVVEDWPWAHHGEDGSELGLTIGELFPHLRGKPALSSLVIEAMLACGSGSQLIEKVVVNRQCALIYRGTGPAPEEAFDIHRAYRLSESCPVTLREGPA